MVVLYGRINNNFGRKKAVKYKFHRLEYASEEDLRKQMPNLKLYRQHFSRCPMYGFLYS